MKNTVNGSNKLKLYKLVANGWHTKKLDVYYDLFDFTVGVDFSNPLTIKLWPFTVMVWM